RSGALPARTGVRPLLARHQYHVDCRTSEDAAFQRCRASDGISIMYSQHQDRAKERGVTLGGSLVYSLVGTGFYLLTQLGVLSGLSHLRGPVAVGEFGLALALTTPLFALANMGLRTAQAVDVTEQFAFA